MDFPKLILPFVPVPAGQDLGSAGAVPVISPLRQSKLIPRFLLTCAAATHCPRFLKPAHASVADSPVSDEILSASFVFLFRMSSMLLPCAEPSVEPPALGLP